MRDRMCLIAVRNEVDEVLMECHLPAGPRRGAFVHPGVGRRSVGVTPPPAQPMMQGTTAATASTASGTAVDADW